ncbi:MAG: Metallo-dependent phosphatase-like protein [Linnemannia gamsii]|nr:MAG: Metallo-dependent phosphatase-like protein [Linnemannia gamsii]
MLRPILVLALLALIILYFRQSPSDSSPILNKNSRSKTAHAAPNQQQQQKQTPPKNGRTVAVGDLHSDLAQTLAVLRLANVVDADSNWSGGHDTLVQTGDIVDRGPDTIAIYKLFDKLRQQAKEAGGKVVNVYGNHEVMNLGGDLRYVTEEDYDSFGGRQKRKEAWDVKTGWLGQQIYSNFNITHIQNGHTAFSHGDMEPEWASLGADTLNLLSREAIWKGDIRYAPIFQGTGPIWSRAHATQEGGMEETCKSVDAAKKALGVNRLISGHTPQYRTGKILSICNGGYMVIDVGISKYYGGHLAVLEIIENDDGTQSVYALYPGGKRLV